MSQSGSPEKDAQDQAPLRALDSVLVVEDDPVLGAAIEAALRDAGAERVALCPSIAGAMAELEVGDLSAVILDVHLADRDDGWALAELVALLGPRRPQIIFSTGAPEDIPPGIAEMGLVFEKPYDPAELVEALAGERRTGLFARLRGSRD